MKKPKHRLVMLFVGCLMLFLANNHTLQAQQQPPNNRFFEKVVFDSVSVNADGNIQLSWIKSTNPDDIGYILYRWMPTYQPVDTIHEIETINWIDLQVNPCDTIPVYAIASFTENGVNPPTDSKPHQTIWLQRLAYRSCDTSALICWSRYINAEPLVSAYRIYRKNASETTAPFVRIAELPVDALSIVDSLFLYGEQANNITYFYEFADKLPQQNETYSFYVQAVFGNKTSSSCVKNIHAQPSPLPDYFQITTIDVDFQTVVIDYVLDTSGSYQSIEVKRSNNENPPQNTQATIEKPIAANGRFYDSNSNIDQEAFYYQLLLLDSCKHVILKTDVHRSLFLWGETTSNNTLNLHWSPYLGWETTHYTLFRQLPGENSLTEIAAIESFDNNFQDILPSQLAENEPIYYQIRAHSNQAFSSHSNLLILKSANGLFLPNAFNPKSTEIINRSFKPVNNFILTSDYLMQVFSRNGILLFESYSITEGWDGTYQGSIMPLGMYVFQISFRKNNGQFVQQRGEVMLVY